MDPVYRFQSVAYWTGGRRGVAQAEAPAPHIAFAAPPEFQGEAGIWTPEHFFLSAIASCFITTFAAIAELSHFVPLGLSLTTEGVIEKTDGGLQFTRVILRPEVRIANEEERPRALRLLEKAERSCLISRSLKAAVEVQPEARVAAVETAA